MRAPEIEFAPRPASRTLFRTAVLVAAIAFVFGALWQYLRIAGELKRVEDQIAAAADAAEQRRSSRPVDAGPSLPQARISAINGAIARLNIPWGELFAAFESQTPKDVALLALLPDARKRSLVVQAEATSPQSMVKFVEQLRAVPLFEEAYLLKHERREQDTGQPYRFAVEVRWKDLP